MSDILNTFLSQISQGDQVHDWQHASKTFIANNYELAPKQSFLYHVFFDLNTNAKLTNGMDNRIKQQELGLMVKAVSLPKYNIDTKNLNAYNRMHIVQTKIHYDPVTITFYDDSADVVRNFWFDYYSYYYRNSDYGGAQDMAPMLSAHNEITSPRQDKDWGYTIRGSDSTTGYPSAPYLRSIRIYSLHNKVFSEYVLMNPIIKSFQHGDHEASATNGTLQHTMTVEFESVQYATGRVGTTEPMAFAATHYDTSPSPLSAAGGGTQSFLGPGGILDSGSEIFSDLQAGNIGAALFKGARVSNGLKGVNLGAMAATTALSVTNSLLTGANNPFGTFTVPSLGSLMSSGTGAAGTTVNPTAGIPIATGANGVSRLPNAVSSQSFAGISGSFDANSLNGVTNVSTAMPPDVPAVQVVDPATQYAGSSGTVSI